LASILVGINQYLDRVYLWVTLHIEKLWRLKIFCCWNIYDFWWIKNLNYFIFMAISSSRNLLKNPFLNRLFLVTPSDTAQNFTIDLWLNLVTEELGVIGKPMFYFHSWKLFLTNFRKINLFYLYYNENALCFTTTLAVTIGLISVKISHRWHTTLFLGGTLIKVVSIVFSHRSLQLLF
jgi:hypothetical protein